jgi:nucleoside-diphosphate-sugar epimerase
VVFASSNHAVGFYPRHHRIGTDVTARPDSRYGVSKVFGEAVGALYADKHGLGVTCLRIGNFGDKPLDHRRLSIWGDAGSSFSLFLRKAFIKAMGYSDDALDRPIVGITDT